MPCVIALIVFSILALFSASHRKLAKEAFDCVFRRITLRPCDTGFDTKVKARVVSSLLDRSPKAARFVNKRFELLSWIFALSMLISTLWLMWGLYNYWIWGSCNGLNSGGFCAFDPTGSHNNVSAASGECIDTEIAQAALTLESVDLSKFPVSDTPSDKSLVMLGCYGCDYTRDTYPLIKKLRENYEFDYTFIHFPTKGETSYLVAYDYCLMKHEPDKYNDFVDKLFSSSGEQADDEEYVGGVIDDLGMDSAVIEECLVSEETVIKVEEWVEEAEKTGIYGTPTVFIDDVAVVGPKPYRVYRRLITGSWF